MVIDIGKFVWVAPHAVNFYKKFKDLEYDDIINRLATFTNAPVIACIYALAFIKGFDKNDEEKINRIKTFYRYSEVLGIDEMKEAIKKVLEG